MAKKFLVGFFALLVAFSVSVQSINNSYNSSAFSTIKEIRFKNSQKILGDTITIQYGDSAKLDAGTSDKSYKWNTGQDSPIIYAKTEGMYSVKLIDNDGFLSNESVYVKVLGVPVVVIPEKDWYIATGGRYADEGFGVATDKKGDIYVTGRFTSSIVFGTNTITSSYYDDNRQTMFLAKLDNKGDLVWYKTGSDIYSSDAGGYGVMVDRDDNVVVYGSFSNDFTFADTTILAKLNNSEKLFVAKLKPTGERIWVKGLGNIERPDQGIYTKTLFGTVDNKNKIIIAGLTTNYGTTFDRFVFKNCYPARNALFVLKLDGDSRLEWAKGASNSGQNQPTGIACDNIDNIYISGYSYDNSSFFFTDTVSQITINKYALLKLTPTGSLDWSISGNGGMSVASDTIGNVYAVGNWSSSTKNINLDKNNPNSILKINNTGKIEWQKSYSDNPLLLKTDRTGNLYYMAQRDSYNSSPYIMDKDTVQAGNRFLCKIDSASNLIYAKTTGENGYYNDMDIDKNENVLLTGGYFTAIFSDSIHKYIARVDTVKHITYYNYNLIGTTVDSKDGYLNLFIAKYCNEIKKESNAINSISPVEILPLRIFPNPAINQLNISLSSSKDEKTETLDIFNMLGKKMKSIDLRNQPSTILHIDCSDIPAGTYFAIIRTSKNLFTGKVMIKRE